MDLEILHLFGSDEEESQIIKTKIKNTINEISEQTKKTKKSIERILAKLRSKGIIQSVKTKGKVVYSKV